MTRSDQTPIGGTCAPRFDSVRDAFERNFTDNGDVGAAVAVWVDGDLVVNLWGGYADAGRRRRRPGGRTPWPASSPEPKA